jgi:uncharacterized repeat protein (TIGR03803 family)
MRRIVKLLWLAGWLALPATSAHGQVVILHTFTGGANDGQNPFGSLIQSGSTLYGTTFTGGSGGDGIVFSVNSDGTGFTLMHSFVDGPNDGRNPSGSLTQIGSTLYGTTQAGGAAFSGTVFKIGTAGSSFGVLHSFTGGPSDGAVPFGTLLQSGSTFYATTVIGGSANLGTVFKLGTDGTGYGVLHSFAGSVSDGQAPFYGALAQSGSTLYGMTTRGGAANLGTIYKIGVDGAGRNLLHSFTGNPGDGEGPQGSLILSGTTLFGMTTNGGSTGFGTVFKINTDGTNYNILHSFAGGPNDGGSPTGSLILAGSELYGMTGGGGIDSLGTIFGIGTDGTNYSVFHSFVGGPADGAFPNGDLILSGSTFFGTTSQGGSSNDGVIFSMPVPEPSSFFLMATGALPILVAARRRMRRLSATRGT